MKYGKYIESKIKPEWREYYIDYRGLKDTIKACVTEAAEGTRDPTAFSPRTTSLTVQRYSNGKDSAQELFFKRLERDVGWGEVGSACSGTSAACASTGLPPAWHGRRYLVHPRPERPLASLCSFRVCALRVHPGSPWRVATHGRDVSSGPAPPSSSTGRWRRSTASPASW